MTVAKFEIEIDKEVNDKIDWFTDNYPKEISGWLVGDITKDLISITDLLIPYQEVGDASVDTSGGDLIKLRKEYGDKCLKIIGHWHSHNTMDNYWSTTDDNFIDEYMEQREKAIFFVSGKGNDHRVRVEIRKPLNISIDELDYCVVSEEVNELGKELLKVIEEKVTEQKIVSVEPTRCYPNSFNVRPGDEIINGEYDDTEYLEQCVNDEFDRRVYYNKRKREVYANGLTMSQQIELEEIGDNTTQTVGDMFDMTFKVIGKKHAKEVIKQVKLYLMDKEEEGEFDLSEDMV